jgi:hypothetical protein
MKDGKFGFDLKGMTYGSDANFGGKEVGYTATPIPPFVKKKFGQNAGWPTATGETESPGVLNKTGES